MTYQLAIIDEEECIGCTKCIQICPYDAIIGANKQLHTILKAECTGCGLCIEPCPVDCIHMIEIDNPYYSIERAKYRRRERRKRLQKHGLTDQKMEIIKETFAKIPPSPDASKKHLAAILERKKKNN